MMQAGEISSEGLQQRLIDEGYITFYPRTCLDVPQVDRDKIAEIFGVENVTSVKEVHIDILVRFLEGELVGDRFPSRQERNDWICEMEKEYGDEIIREAICYKINKLRRSKLWLVWMTIEDLAYLAEEYNEEANEELVGQLRGIQEELGVSLLGGRDSNSGQKVIPYDQLDNDYKKLEVIQYFDKKVVAVLEMLSSSDGTSKRDSE